jgi:hypothetical protein
MPTSPRSVDAPRFVAYSTLTREPVMVGHTAADLLTDTRAKPSLGYDSRFVEILDCGADGPDAATVDLRLDAARLLYRTVFRGSGSLSRPGMPPLALQDALPAAPDRAAARAIEDGLSALVDRARAAGLLSVASLLHRTLDDARAELAEGHGSPVG